MDFPERDSWIKSVQRKLNLLDDGKDGPKTWGAIMDSLNIDKQNITTPFSKKAFDLILKYEIGGGRIYYDKYLKNPVWPKGASGITIGIGYDLGYNSLDQFEKDWKDKLPPEDFNVLKQAVGVKSIKAAALADKLNLKSIFIPWEIALSVFENSTLPRFIEETKKAFPESEKLHPDAFGALVSLVFNRGASMEGDTRREMKEIRDLVPRKNYKAIGRRIREMKRLWVGKGLNGLLVRRDEEASLVENCS